MIIARFSEHHRYDINDDAEKILFVATTARGSYFSEILDQGPANLREMREKFKQSAAECIQLDIEPAEIDLA